MTPPEGGAVGDAPPGDAVGSARRQHYVKKSDAKLDRLVRAHIGENGGSFNDVLDLLDRGGVQRYRCPLCDEWGSEEQAHDGACCARSIAKTEEM
ncbi:hypothetical protein ABTZ93_05045 [Streptomyces sp. NPDC097941]|uniref:hypothetical protein n=1 Tax=Streptomyces sp. NPDC097941 TaxID=3155685 RepID=UPI00331CE403